MEKNETVYDIVFSVYELKHISNDEKNTVRQYIRRHLEKEFGKGYSWDALSSVQKDTFVYITIRQTMLERYVKHNEKKINSRIDEYLKKTFLKSDKAIKTHNSTVEPLFTNLYNPSDSDYDKKEKYKLLCSSIKNFNSQVPIPTYDEWINYPLRAYDYISTYENEMPVSENEYAPTQREIDHVILMTLIKQLNININIPLINECLTFLGNAEVDRFGMLLDEYDPNIDLSREEQEKIIKANRQYETYKKMLDELAFT